MRVARLTTKTYMSASVTRVYKSRAKRQNTELTGFICSKLILRDKRNINCVIILSLLLTLNKFFRVIWCFYCWFWTYIYLHPSFVKSSQVSNLIKCNCWNLRKTSMKSLKQACEEIQVTNPTRRCPIQKLFWQYSRKNTCAEVFLLIRL